MPSTSPCYKIKRKCFPQYSVKFTHIKFHGNAFGVCHQVYTRVLVKWTERDIIRVGSWSCGADRCCGARGRRLTVASPNRNYESNLLLVQPMQN
jgi:hypothetical protein